ncbi:peptidoglycan-associated lipoprotein Pal [Sphaerotilus mobilis]|uniref:Peptidoglycan-associated protein n=1 Tax=Sphaerotilus mobilis TaxID=47994 RepID=A0A4Q7LSP2_9BURK|nr:peptidoglycan-associated lipoprotein Pal [Sphaerotilus mobilis]RZS56679.1 peptidoglycan-associated lipoprotein [Sphaerotilus mobilis]
MNPTYDHWIRPLRLAAAAGVVVLLSACASSTRLDPPAPVEDRNRGASSALAGGGAGGAAGVGTVNGGQAGGTALPGDNRIPSIDLGSADNGAGGNAGLPRVVYFDFDSYVVKDDYRNVIEAHARYLSADRKRRLLVEGHTDERGGREYNLALGQKRADAVVRALGLLGTGGAQTEAVSYGKERPAASGNDEASWAKNRRVELKDR